MRFAPLTRRGLAAAVLAGLAALAAPGSARAAFVYDSKVDITSKAPTFGTGGAYKGSIEVDNNTATSASVRFTLTNTSASQYLTSFGFSLPNTLGAGTGLSTKPTTNWQLLGDADFSNGSMFDTGSFGYFDIGAAVGSTWHVGGASVNGIAPGQTGTFVFDLVGAGANVTATQLMMEMSTNGSAGIGARFRTAGSFSTSDGSKVLAYVTKTYPPPSPPGAVPAPPAVLLALAGVGTCLAGRGFRRRATPAAGA